jgi:hypothetical protein
MHQWGLGRSTAAPSPSANWPPRLGLPLTTVRGVLADLDRAGFIYGTQLRGDQDTAANWRSATEGIHSSARASRPRRGLR